MSGPVATKSDKDKAAKPAKESSLEVSQRSISPGPHGDIMGLQRSAGNRAVNNLFQPDLNNVPPIVYEVLRSQGQPIDPGIRFFMEAHFGHGFSQVRVHTDNKANDSAQAVDALAYTVGRDIVFSSGSYSPGTESGLQLLGHELAHVVQQGGQKVSDAIPLRVGKEDSSLERMADNLSSPIAPNNNLPLIGVVQRQHRESASGNLPDPAKDLSLLLFGLRRARIVREFAQELRKKGTIYEKEIVDVTRGSKKWKEARKDWDNYKLADCTKFLQWALEESGQGKLIGRQNTSISLILNIIAGLQGSDQPTFKPIPIPGDLMLWTGHVAIVLNVWESNETQYFSFAHMGTSGVQLAGEGNQEMKLDLNKGERPGYNWKAWGNGTFLGFWTPPLPEVAESTSRMTSETQFELGKISHTESVLQRQPAHGPARLGRAGPESTVIAPRGRSHISKADWTDFTFSFILNNASQIKFAAKKLNISPIAIAGVVAWEREENPKGYYSDFWQGYECSLGLISEKAGIGYGSTHLNVAEEIEKAGKVWPAKDIKERCERLKDASWAISYISAIMNQAADNYERIAGINIRNAPGILATLYHTGKSREKAMKLKEKIALGLYPEPDEMGRWINEHFIDLSELLHQGK